MTDQLLSLVHDLPWGWIYFSASLLAGAFVLWKGCPASKILGALLVGTCLLSNLAFENLRAMLTVELYTIIDFVCCIVLMLFLINEFRWWIATLFGLFLVQMLLHVLVLPQLEARYPELLHAVALNLLFVAQLVVNCLGCFDPNRPREIEMPAYD